MAFYANAFNLRPKKSLGQNFLIDKSVIQHIVQSANNFLFSNHKTEATILEIGPGTGALTKALLNLNNKCTVTALEKDTRAFTGLKNSILKEYPTQLILHEGDILKFSPSQFDLCIGNIPYYITSDILMWLCEHKNKFLGALFMIQDEVANRVCAHINTKEYSRLSIKMQLNFKIKKLFKVPKENFVPKPKVNSAVVLFIPNHFSFKTLQEEKDFEEFTTLLFSHRRKMLRRIFFEHLKSVSEENKNLFLNELIQLNINQTDRPESISPHNMVLLFKSYQKLCASVSINLLP